MRKITTHFTVSGLLLACLLLTLSQVSFAQCPHYPRAMDQVFVCYDPAEKTIKLDPAATIHNPVRFTFPEIPADVTVTFDYNTADTIPGTIVTANGEVSAAYPSPGQYQLHFDVRYISGYNGPQGGPHVPIYDTKSVDVDFQSKFNPDAVYGDFLPDLTWDTLAGRTYTPEANGAYPPG